MKTTPSAGFVDRHAEPRPDLKSKLRVKVCTNGARSRKSEPPVAASTNLALDRYVGREIIGVGGMATVVRAFDKVLLRDVAIKIPNRESASARESTRFAREAQVTAELEHPNVIPVYDFGTNQRGVPFISMKLVKGETLEDTLARIGPARLEPAVLHELTHVFVRVCDAIAHAHSLGFIHRDLKPSNVMIGELGQVYVIDWGVAHLISVPSNDVQAHGAFGGEVVGTLRYMAPEQLQALDGRLDERTDVFGLGAILYEVLTGQPPHEFKALADIAFNRAQVVITPPDAGAVSAALSRIAVKAMSHEMTKRYQSVRQLREEVERFQDAGRRAAR